MKPAIYRCMVAAFAVFTVSCNNESAKETAVSPAKDTVAKAEPSVVDLELKETHNQEDTAWDSFPAVRLQSIRDNFKRINSIASWPDTVTVGLSETTDGGEARYYFREGKLEKITAQQYGETFHQLTEYYLLNGQLSFVYDRSYRYNRPMYYDSAAMKENKDTETFDPKKATLVETRSYFENGQLLHQIHHNETNDTPASSRQTEEQKRLLEDFQKLVKLSKAKKSS